jgi:hypothetical protein
MAEELIPHCSPSSIVGNRADCGLGLIRDEIRDASGPNCGPETKDQLKSDTRARLPCDEPGPFFRSFDKRSYSSSMLSEMKILG